MTNELKLPFISVLTPGIFSVFAAFANYTGNGTWPTANKAFYHPFSIPNPFLTDKVGVIVAISSGNLDVGIYTEDGRLIVSSGAVAVPAAGARNIAIPQVLLKPGRYWLAMSVSNTTAQFIRSGSTLSLHYREELSAHPLPSVADLSTVITSAYGVLIALGRPDFSWE
jgi:hypothetical protein